MDNVKTGELLSFQDYSPDHNKRARIDVESVHTNNYTLPTNPTTFDDIPKISPVETEEVNNANHNFWSIKYYQKYFDVQSQEVLERIISSVFPLKVSPNFFEERIRGRPDLYGPIWISVTLIFTIAVSGNIANYFQNTNNAVHWRYDFHLVSYAATAIFCYVWLVPIALWAALKTTIVEDAQDVIETQDKSSPSMISLFCLYGYSLSIYVPVSILWTIQISWLQWLLVITAALVSGAVLIFWLLPVLRKSKYYLPLVISILGVHFLLAAGFMLYFFHVPNTSSIPTIPIIKNATLSGGQ